jgi:hypothetical protein
MRIVRHLQKLVFKLPEELLLLENLTESKFAKKCLLIAVSKLCPYKNSVFENVSLSRMTVQWRVTDISNNPSNQLRERAEKFKYYSLAMDESTDSTDTAQLLILICSTDENLQSPRN